jgi:hypothetical protein
MKRNPGFLGVVAMLLVAAIGLTAEGAHAAIVVPYGSCGVGFTLVRKEAVVRADEAAPAAAFYLAYSVVTGTYCGITRKSRYIGVETETSAGVGGASGKVITSSGPQLYLAGPVWDRPGFGSNHRCVLYGASLTAPDGRTYYHESANPAIGWSMYCPA